MGLKCPSCKSGNIIHYMGGQFGKYECKNCGYIGVIVIEDANKKRIKKGNKGIGKKRQ